MSLKVWLPLNGDLENKGCSNVEVVNNGAILDNNGKIGKCYYFNGTSSNYMTTTYSTAIGTNDFSISLWLKIPTLTSGSYFAICSSKTALAASSGFGIYWNYSLKKFLWSTADGSTATEIWMNTVVNDIVYDKWIHLVMVRNNADSKKGYFYINNQRYELASIPPIRNITTDTKVWIGRCSDGYYPAKMYVNDFRIYDHALSAAEVREISLGLVVHYKLNDAVGFTDIIKNLDNYVVYNNFSGSGTTGTLVNLSEHYNGTVVRRETMTPNDNSVSNFRNSLGSHGVYGHGQTFLANTKYVFWIYFRPISHLDVRVGGTASNIGGWTEIPPTFVGNGWYRVGQYRDGSITTDKSDLIFTSFYTPTATSGVPIIIDWASPHLLLGTTEIPPYDYPSTIILDSSGYNNHGTIVGLPKLSKLSLRYNYSTSFDGVSDCIVVPYNLVCPENIFTINLWFKKDALGSKNYETLFGGPGGFEMDTRAGSSTTLSLYLASTRSGTRNSVTPLSLGEWYMVTMVRDGIKERYYINGIFQSEIDAKSMPTGVYRIGAWASNTVQNYYGLISDFRIYCTALSAEDIKQLYNTNLKIDDKHNIHTFTIEESNLNSDLITKTGNLKSINFNENGYLEFLHYDKEIYTEPDGSKWVHVFHHNNPTAIKFDNTNQDWLHGKYISADAWYDLEPIVSNLVNYEFLYRQKTTDTGSITTYRWTQPIDPVIATWADVSPSSGNAVYNTSTGYTNSSMGGMYLMLSSQLHMCIANTSNGNWYGGIGVSTAYLNGIPGYPNTVVTTGCIDLYVRIYLPTKLIKDKGISTLQYIEK